MSEIWAGFALYDGAVFAVTWLLRHHWRRKGKAAPAMRAGKRHRGRLKGWWANALALSFLRPRTPYTAITPSHLLKAGRGASLVSLPYSIGSESRPLTTSEFYRIEFGKPDWTDM